MDWDKLKVFFAVAEAGNFTKAAVKLSLSQSAISRQISSLEESLGAPLFYRHARGLFLTEQGEQLFKTAREVVVDLSMTEALITDKGDKIQGKLKITSSIGFGAIWLTPKIPEFLRRYPDLNLSFIFSDDVVDLSIHEADIALSSVFVPSESMYGRPFFKAPMGIYASREYLLAHGVPLKIEDLDQHQLVVFGDNSKIPSTDVNWLLSCGRAEGGTRVPYITINNLYGIGRAVEAGAGIACIPPYIASHCHGLIQVLPEVETPLVTFNFVCADILKGSPKIEALYQYLKEFS
ncbi:LysR family transcriptional regulator [Candidatus Bealeia paramacronuclearis]|uniref:LysR family transcriptional regulator n=1 Tax=Candidatus Bealeia paramacronuclearis TaxID=1921001 RepID=A0ABZ2C4R9_9PROT|nr:LysR family transcriptional regulator [Candidatus Bealeia paramacronuclearis]